MRSVVALFIAICTIALSGQTLAQQRSPVQLLHLSAANNSKIQFNENTVRDLFFNPKLKDRQVVVFSIVGAFRKGKSFLLNYMLRYLYAHYPSLTNTELINEGDDWMGEPEEPLTGFEWKSGVARVTKGLILWGDVFLHDGPRNEKYAIYIMDTQGLFDTDTTTAENSKIFSLSTLISSIQILNIFNILQEDQLQYLQFATEYARYGSSDSDKSPFQDLLILIRDWNGVDEYRYGLRGGNAYLNTFLEIHDYQAKELQSVRRYLKSSFEKINCFLMPYPGKTVAVDKRYDGRWISIDDDFVTMMNELFNHLFKKLKPKLINGKTIKPDELLVFINSYVESFKNDSFPSAVSIYDSTLDQQFRILMAKSVDLYVEAVSSHDSEIDSEEDINKLHLAAKDKALKHFNSEKKFGTYSEGMNFKKELVKTIEESYKQWKAVAVVQLRKINAQKAKTQDQVRLLQSAELMDKNAKQRLEEAAAKMNEAKAALDQAKTDTAEARREAEELKRKYEDAQKERAEAIEKENQTREWLRKMSQDKEFYEQEYNKLKQQAASTVGGQLSNTSSENGFERVLGQITGFFAKAAPIIATISSWFG
ncbi:atlastin-like [Chironomus tepperi]|uniref:atlastin-like n=1 Tax=Chironomus tepperi TaxID=113505 RepID=UPI00391F1D5A